MKVTLHTHHHSLTPSKQRSRAHALTGLISEICPITVALLPFALKAHILSHSSWSTAGMSGTKTHYHLWQAIFARSTQTGFIQITSKLKIEIFLDCLDLKRRQYNPLKCELFTHEHSVTYQRTSICNTTVTTSNLTWPPHYQLELCASYLLGSGIRLIA